jgi:uracil-DNA glycosylase
MEKEKAGGPNYQDKWDSMFTANIEELRSVESTVDKEIAEGKVFYPPRQNRYRAFSLCPLDNVKVILLGDEPYNGPGQADGLAWSSTNTIPPDLQQIFIELHKDLGCYIPKDGSLESWAKQGVLLLNCALTSRRNIRSYHIDLWQHVMDNFIEFISDNTESCVWILWGAIAKSKQRFIDQSKHAIVLSDHPSPLGCWVESPDNFRGSKPFSTTNELLKSPIIWGEGMIIDECEDSDSDDF